MPVLSVLAPLLKSRFFVIYYRCVTLADGMGEPLVAIGGSVWYTNVIESEGFL